MWIVALLLSVGCLFVSFDFETSALWFLGACSVFIALWRAVASTEGFARVLHAAPLLVFLAAGASCGDATRHHLGVGREDAIAIAARCKADAVCPLVPAGYAEDGGPPAVRRTTSRWARRATWRYRRAQDGMSFSLSTRLSIDAAAGFRGGVSAPLLSTTTLDGEESASPVAP